MTKGSDVLAGLRTLRAVSAALAGDGESARASDALAAVVPPLADGAELRPARAGSGVPELARGVPVPPGDQAAVEIPLIARGVELGVLRLVREPQREPWGEADLLVAEEVAQRIATAVDVHALAVRAEQAGELQDAFLATLSHELRTPLNVMVGWIDLLRSGRLAPERQARGLELLARNARVQTRLIGDLLDASGIMSGRLGLELGDVAVADLVEETVEVIRPRADDAEITITARVGARGTIRADGERLGQVLHNLIGNALKFTPSGGAVRVWADVDGDRVVLGVEDSGAGIDPALLPSIFDRFRQGGRTGGGSRGLGLGLFIVRHLVRLHGGSIAAASDGPGRGSRFTITLPVAGPGEDGPATTGG